MCVTTSPSQTAQKQKKRPQYHRVSDDMKRDLVFRVMYLNESIRDVCDEISCNFLTGRNLIQRYKKTGEYVTSAKAKLETPPPQTATRASGQEPTPRRDKCPIGIILLGDDEMRLVSSKVFTPAEHDSLLALHQHFTYKGLP
jgi:hypothetical protein